VTGSINSINVLNDGLWVWTYHVFVTCNNATALGDVWVSSMGYNAFTIKFENQPGANTVRIYWIAYDY
jgi:hypothetical protein